MRTRPALILGLALCLMAPWAISFRSASGEAEATGSEPTAASVSRTAAGGLGESKITAAEPVHDFGSVFEGAELQHTFVLQAGGEADLIVHKVKPSCGCTVANMWVIGADGARTEYEEGTPVAPGSQLALDTTFKTVGKKGRQEKPVQVYANIPAGSIELEIRAQVQAFLSINPERIVLERFSVREEREGSAEVRSFSGDAVKLVLPEQKYPDKLTVRLEPVDPDESGRAVTWRVVARMAKGADEGPFHHMLQIDAVDGAAASDGAEPSGRDGRGGRVSIAGQVLGLVSATPNYMSFGAVRGATGTAKTVRINSNVTDIELGEPQLTLLDPREEAPYELAEYFRATARRVEDVAGAWDVELWVGDLPNSINGPFRARLRVDFGHRELTLLEIPFTGFHRPE